MALSDRPYNSRYTQRYYRRIQVSRVFRVPAVFCRDIRGNGKHGRRSSFPFAQQCHSCHRQRRHPKYRQSVRRLSRPVEITAQSEAPIRRTLHIRESFTLHPTLPVSICPPPRLSVALIRRVTPPHIWKAGGTAIKRAIWRRYSTVRLCISRTAACTVERHRQPHSLTLPMSPQQ